MELALAATTPIIAFGLLSWERLAPARPLPAIRGWHARALALNLAIAPLMVLGGLSWEPGCAIMRGWMLARCPRRWPAFSAFWCFSSRCTVGTSAKHAHDGLWRWLHQIHHSPKRIEVLTTHYAHPLEFGIGLALAGALLYGALGLSPAAFAWFALFETTTDLLQHANIRTPHWLGYVLQRPEMHRLHHERGVHAGNYGLPLWDALFGSWRNPRGAEVDCGFDGEREQRLDAMLVGVDVHAPLRPRCCFAFS